MSVSEANGIEVRTPVTHDETAEARRFAAAVDRTDPLVEWVREQARGDGVVIMLPEDGGDRGSRFTPPTGWQIDDAFVSSVGGVMLTLTRDK